MFNIDELKKTLELCKDEISGNRELTNEYMVDDVLRELGYNKKRNKDVKRVVDGPLDWEITEDGNTIAIRVAGFGTTLRPEEKDEIASYCAENSFDILIITDGNNFEFYKFKDESNNYVIIDKLTITKPLTERNKSILSAISNGSFDIEFLNSLLVASSIELSTIKEIMRTNLDSVANLIANLMCTDTEDDINSIKEILTSIIDNTATEDNTESESNSDETSTESSNNGGEISNEEIDNYNKRIERLKDEIVNISNKVASKETEIERLNGVVKELNEEIAKNSGEGRKNAVRMLDAVANSISGERRYIFVINYQLSQFDNIFAFVNTAFQTLYKLKQYDAYQAMYDGDTFKLISVPQEDMHKYENLFEMNNKFYYVKLDGLSEDEILNKLRQMFAQFDDIIFECRKTGVLNFESEVDDDDEEDDVEFNPYANEGKTTVKTSETEDEEESTYENEETSSEEFSESEDESEENKSNFDDDIFGGLVDIEGDETETEELEDESEEFEEETSTEDFEPDNFEEENSGETNEEEINFSDDDFESLTDTEEEEEESEEFEETDFDEVTESIDEIDDESKYKHLLCCNIGELDELMYSPDKVKFETVSYFGNSNHTFRIDTEHNINLGKVTSMIIESIIALAIEQDREIVRKFKGWSLETVDNTNIRIYSNETLGEEWSRINGTRYVVKDLGSVIALSQLIKCFAETFEIDYSDMYMYFDVETSSEKIVEEYGYTVEELGLEDSSFYNGDSGVHTKAIIKGNAFNCIYMTKTSNIAFNDIIKGVLGVKTNYLAERFKSTDSFYSILEQIINEAPKTNKNNNGEMKELDTRALGKVIGQSYQLVSFDESDVSENHREISYCGDTLYVSEVEDLYSMVMLLIRAHVALSDNTGIAVQVRVDTQAIEYYNDFETSNNSLYLCIRSFLAYIDNQLKH